MTVPARRDSERPAIEPRLLSKTGAAAYCGLTPGGYDAWVKAGRLPGPISGTHRYDKKAIDAALDRLSGLTAAAEEDRPGGAYDKWKREREIGGG